MRICPRCKKVYDDTWKICLNCNIELNDDSTSDLKSEKIDEKTNNAISTKKYKTLTFLYPLKIIISLVLFFYSYSFYATQKYNLGLELSSNFSLEKLLGYILMGCPSMFFIFAVSLLPLIKRHRMIFGMCMLFVLFIYQLFYFPISNWFISLMGLSNISFELFGGLLGLMLVTMGKQDLITRQHKSGRLPKPNIFLVVLSLISVPLAYPFLLLAAFITVFLACLGLYAVIQMERIPVAIIIALVLAPIVAIWASLKAVWVIFFHKPDSQNAIKIDNSKSEILNSAINEVCTKVKTKKPDVVLLHAEPTFFVMQGKISSYDGIVKGRILAIGAPLLYQLKYNEFKSILAHEFSHFSGKDTLYSIYVYPLYKSLITAMQTMEEARKGQGSSLGSIVFNLFLLMPTSVLNLYLKYFATIDKALSRNRELRADWVAANIYGRDTMATALKKVHSVSTHYNDTAYNLAINSADNFFDDYQKLVYSDNKKLDQYEALEMSREENDFDSHPTISIRLTNLPIKECVEEEDKIKNMLEETKNDIKRLSSTFTDKIKAVKEYYDKISKLIEESKQGQPKTLLTKDPLICPKCNKSYDDSWKVCLSCNENLVKNPNVKPGT